MSPARLLALLLPLAALSTAGVPSRAQAPGDEGAARALVAAAERAVEGDSARALAARWDARLARDGGDRGALLGRATVARLTYDDSTAERLYARLHAGDPAPPDAYAAWAHVGRGQLLDRQNRLGEIGAELERALTAARASREVVAEAAALMELAFLRANTVGVPAGFAALDSAAGVLPAGETALRAHLYRRRAIILAAIGDRGARAAADTALAWARRAGTPGVEGACMRALAQVYDLTGQGDSAVVTYERAETLLRAAHDRAQLALTMVRRSNVLRGLGRLGEMRAVLTAALAESRAARDAVTTASTATGLAALSLQLGDLPAAAEHLRAARAHFSAVGDSANLSLVEHFSAAVALAARDFAAARRHATTQLAWVGRVGDHAQEVEALRMLASVELEAGDLAAAGRALARAGAIARAQRHAGWQQGLRRDEARLRIASGDLDAAERLLERYLADADTAEHLYHYDARMRLAEVHARRGALDRATAEARRADELLDRWRATLSDRKTRVLAFQATATEREQERAGAAFVVRALVAGGRAADAFMLAEHRRARELGDRLRQAAALRDRPSGDAAAAGHLPATPATDLAALTAALPDSTALLEYVTGGDAVTLFVLTRAGLRGYALAATDSLSAGIGSFVALLESGAAPGGLARRLGAALLDTALAELPAGVRRLVVVPDGPLHRVPFDALRMRDGRYLVEHHTVTIAPSAGVLALLRARPPRSTRAAARVLAFGDPAFADAVAGDSAGASRRGVAAGTGAVYRSAFAATGGLPRLAGAGREARLVAGYGDSAVIRVREDASEAYLLHAPIDGFDVVHFATHAIVDDRSMGRAALALAPGGGDDGFVMPGELATLRLRGALVVLSACRTAGGALVGGEGVDGLTAPLLEAGARAVVATGWRVEDTGVLPLVERMYDALARGMPIGEAVRAAKLDAIRRGVPPGEWAAFQVVGDPLVRVPLRVPPRAPSRWWLLAGGAAVLLAGAALYGRRMRSGRAAERTLAPSSV